MHPIMNAQRGFTLLEIMVVVVIIAVLSAVVAPNMFAASNRGRDMEREASTLAARIRVAQDDAMLEGHEYGIVFVADGYRFVRWDPSVSRFLALPASWTQRELENDVKVSAAADSRDPILVLPEPKEDEEEKTVGDDKPGQEQDWQPSVFVLSSGEVTPFTAVFSAEGAEQSLELRVDALGNRLNPPGAAETSDLQGDAHAG